MLPIIGTKTTKMPPRGADGVAAPHSLTEANISGGPGDTTKADTSAKKSKAK